MSQQIALGGIMVGTMFPTMLTLIAFVSLILRLCGFRSVWSREKSGVPNDRKKMSKGWRIFVEGVVIWGWTMALSYVLYGYFKDLYLGHAPATFDVVELISRLFIFSIAGIFLGWRWWERFEKQI